MSAVTLTTVERLAAATLAAYRAGDPAAGRHAETVARAAYRALGRRSPIYRAWCREWRQAFTMRTIYAIEPPLR